MKGPNRAVCVSILLSAILSAGGPGTAHGQVGAEVQVRVHEEHVAGGWMYKYVVTNKSKASIVILAIGAANVPSVTEYNPQPELSVLPKGWDPRRRMLKSSATSPLGWRSYVVTVEESPKHWLEWEAIRSGSGGVRPGETVSGFGVLVPQEDELYKSGHYNVVMDDSKVVSGVLSSDNARSH